MSTIPRLINLLKTAKGEMVGKAKEITSKETCFYSGQVGHCKRNCKAYLESKKEVACDASSTSCIYVIKVNIVSLDNIWVLDTSCDSYICNDMQSLRNSRKLTKGEFDLRVGNGARVATVSIWTYVLNLPCGLCLSLDGCCYVPASIFSFLFE